MLWSIRRKVVLLPPKTKAMKTRYLIGVLFLALAVCSCQKPVEYPIEPKIAYEGFTYLINADSTFSGEGIVSFSYTDGDGDLGPVGIERRQTLGDFVAVDELLALQRLGQNSQGGCGLPSSVAT